MAKDNVEQAFEAIQKMTLDEFRSIVMLQYPDDDSDPTTGVEPDILDDDSPKKFVIDAIILDLVEVET